MESMSPICPFSVELRASPVRPLKYVLGIESWNYDDVQGGELTRCSVVQKKCSGARPAVAYSLSVLLANVRRNANDVGPARGVFQPRFPPLSARLARGGFEGLPASGKRAVRALNKSSRAGIDQKT